MMVAYSEFKFWFFGVAAGFRNLAKGGVRYGVRNVANHILQPINSYTRFPEYHFINEVLRSLLRDADRPLRVLDVGSPKLMGLYAAMKSSARVTMTDISPLNVDLYQTMWEGMRKGARGQSEFELQDARKLTYESGCFDVVYAMSVVEHIEGPGQDGQSVREMFRVLKPGGTLILTMPFGTHYLEQKIQGFANAVELTHDGREYFFQRIYDAERLEEQILSQLRNESDSLNVTTVFRREGILLRGCHQLRKMLPHSVIGVFGFLNPVLSRLLNRHAPGVAKGFYCRYNDVHTFGDIFGDVVVVARKSK